MGTSIAKNIVIWVGCANQKMDVLSTTSILLHIESPFCGLELFSKFFAVLCLLRVASWARVKLRLSPDFSPTSSRDGKAPVRPGVSRRESDAGVYSHFKVDEQRILLEWRDDLIVVADGW
jgi:hypothetical protein